MPAPDRSPHERERAKKRSSRTALKDAGQTATISATLLATGMIQLAGPVGLTLRFVPPIKAESAAAKFSLSTPPAHYTYDAGEPPATYDRRADVNLRYFDAAYQELGLNSLPTRFAFAGNAAPAIGTPAVNGATDKIEFTLFVDETEVLITIDHLSTLKTIGDLVDALNTALSAELPKYGKNALDVRA